MIFAIAASLPLALQAAALPNQDETTTIPDAATVAPAPVTTDKGGETAAITDKNHPDFVRCKSFPVAGSRVQRKKACHTNREWELISRNGNRAASELLYQPRVGGVN